VCKYNDYGDAEITSWASTPTSGASGTKFDVAFTFATKNGTSTGELRVRVYVTTPLQPFIENVGWSGDAVCEGWGGT
jgi:hypothetical protein